MSPFAHGCDPLCDQCVAEQLSQLSGTAQCRGEEWARSIARVCPIDKPWPHTDHMLEIAARKVRDLTQDERLRELLIAEVVLGAERWWNRALERTG